MTGDLEGQGIDSEPFLLMIDQQIIDYDVGIVIEEELITDSSEQSSVDLDTDGDSSESTAASGVDEPSYTIKSGKGWDFSLVNYDYSAIVLGNAESFVVFDEAIKYLSIDADVT